MEQDGDTLGAPSMVTILSWESLVSNFSFESNVPEITPRP